MLLKFRDPQLHLSQTLLAIAIGLCDSKGIRTQNHLVPKQTLKHYPKKAILVTCKCSFRK